MRHTTLLTQIIVLISSLTSLAQVVVTDYGDIPEDRLAISRWQDLKWDDSGNWQTIDVTTKGILPNKSNDIAPLVTDLINSGNGKRILKFPAGTYNIKSRMNISKNDIQIVGVGKDTKFKIEGGGGPGTIFTGGTRSGDYRLAQDASRGDNTMTLTSANAFGVGDYIYIRQAGSVTRPGASGDQTQIFKITAKSGNTLTLDIKFGIPFQKAHAKLEKLNFRKNVRFHNFYMELTSKPTGNHDNIGLSTVQNVEVSNVESNRAYSSHVQVFRGREVIFRNNNFYGNYGGGGGFQYGIKINFGTNCHMINNVASDLRHHYATQFGSNHCVIAYNRALPPYNDYADYGQHNSKGCHNNLFEGNYGKEIYDDANPRASWGTRYTMWFRNHATSKVGSENEYVEYMNIIGNELKGNSSAIKMGRPGKFTFSGANIVNVNKEGGTGDLVWGDLNENSAIPASLFLKDRPSYAVRWPLYGPKASAGNPENKIYSASGPITVEQGEKVTIPVNYQSIGDNDLIVMFQLGENPFTTFQEVRTSVGKESGTKNLELIIPLDVPVAENEYKFQVYLTSPGGGWVERLDNLETINVSVTEKEIKGPFLGIPTSIPGVIEFENFDKGGAGVSYNDSNIENKGAERTNFRVNDGVDIDNGNGSMVIGWTADDEWLEYTVDVVSDDVYRFEFSVSSLNGGGLLGLEVDENNIMTELEIPTTGDWNTYTTFKEDVELTSGEHVMRFKIENSGFNLDKVEIEQVSITSTTKNVVDIKMALFPNPSETGIFHLNKKTSWEVFTFQGIRIKSGEGNQINLSDQNKGVYLLNFEGQTTKIMVK